MRSIAFAFGLLFTFFSCTKKEDPIVPIEPPVNTFNEALTLNKCTGINLRDENGQALGFVGNPNVREGNSFPYPNPAQNVLSIFTTDNLKEVFFVKAHKDTAYAQTDFGALFQKNAFNLDSIKLQKYKSLDLLGGSANYSFNVEAFEKGYYRLFFQTENDSVFCDNVYINPNSFANESYLFLLDDWK